MSPESSDKPQPESSDASQSSDERAALEQVQPDRLLAGEDSGTTHLDDAIHWVKVYSELLEFKRSVLATTEKHVVTMDPDAGIEVQQTDLKALHAEAMRFERRLVFWRTRTAELDAQSRQ